MAIRSTLDGKKSTPNQFAKEMVLDGAQTALYKLENYEEEWDAMTQREKDLVEQAIEKQFDRVQKFLGFQGFSLG